MENSNSCVVGPRPRRSQPGVVRSCYLANSFLLGQISNLSETRHHLLYFDLYIVKGVGGGSSLNQTGGPCAFARRAFGGLGCSCAAAVSYPNAASLGWEPQGNSGQNTKGKTEAAPLRCSVPNGTDITLHDISAAGAVLFSEDNKGISMMLSTPESKAERDFSWLKSSVVTGISQDGKLLLFSEQYAGGGSGYSVYLRKADGSDAVRLSKGSSLGLSRDGEWAAASVAGSTGDELWILPTGPGTPKRLPNFGIQYYYAADWLPDNKRILFSGEMPRHKPCFYLVDTEGGGFRRMTRDGTYGAASWSGNIISPDGKRFFAKDTNQNLWVYPVDEGTPQLIGRIGAADVPFQWTSDGSAVFLYRQGIVPSQVYRVSIHTGRMDPWKQLRPANSTGMLAIIAAVSTTDGRSYTYSFDRWLSDPYLVDGLK
jgi:hypothetical protein